mgnify:CR=1 FL=1
MVQQYAHGVASRLRTVVGGLWLVVTESTNVTSVFSVSLRFSGKTFDLHLEDIGDYGLIVEILHDKEYSLNIPYSPTSILDLGANIGLATLCYHATYPNANIYCFEPDPQNYRRLKQHTQFSEKICCFNLAVGSSNNITSFYVDPHRGSSSSLSKRRSRQRRIMLETKTLGSILDNLPLSAVDVLKFDIEGAEEEVLLQFADYSKIRTIVGEIHYDLVESPDALKKRLESSFNLKYKVKSKSRSLIIGTTHERCEA